MAEAKTRAHYRYHWPGWLIADRAAPGEGLHCSCAVRRTSNLVRSRIDHLRTDQSVYGRQLFLHFGDLTDGTALRRIFAKVQPAEVYHLAVQSHVGLIFQIAESTSEEVAMATLRLLEIARDQ